MSINKNCCFWTVVLEKTLVSPLDCKEIQPIHSEGDQPWVFFGRNDAKAETPVLWPPHVKSWLIGKDSDAGRDWEQEEKGMTKDEMAGWYHWVDECGFGWTPGVGDGQGGLACFNSWGCKESERTEWLNWTELSCVFDNKLVIAIEALAWVPWVILSKCEIWKGDGLGQVQLFDQFRWKYGSHRHSVLAADIWSELFTSEISQLFQVVSVWVEMNCATPNWCAELENYPWGGKPHSWCLKCCE